MLFYAFHTGGGGNRTKNIQYKGGGNRTTNIQYKGGGGGRTKNTKHSSNELEKNKSPIAATVVYFNQQTHFRTHSLVKIHN